MDAAFSGFIKNQFLCAASLFPHILYLCPELASRQKLVDDNLREMGRPQAGNMVMTTLQ